MYTFTIAPYSLGWMGLVRSRRGLCHVAQPMRYAGDAALSLVSYFGAELSRDDEGFAPLVSRIHRFLEGETVDFNAEPLDVSSGTSFQQRVWQAVRSIPYGETRSYAWVAEQAGRPRAIRAAGQAIGANPVPIIIPCHRVVGSNGRLTGFGWGLSTKEQLLEIERGGLTRARTLADASALLV